MSSSFDARDAGSIGVNPTVANIDITTATTDWLWAVFAIMLVSDLVFIFLSFRVSNQT
jgi:bacteriorhodopsin